MKQFYILFLIGFAIIAMSNSGGRANVANSAATLGPGEGGITCSSASCHGTNNYAPEIVVTMTDAAGAEVEAYTPGETYTVSIAVNATMGTPIGYGFQMMCIDNEENSYNGFSATTPGGTGVTTLANGRDYFEHNVLRPENSASIEWTAPDESVSSITFYTAGIAANGNGNTAGDGGTSAQFTFNQQSVSTNDLSVRPVSLLQNPVSDMLLFKDLNQSANVQIYSLDGVFLHADIANGGTMALPGLNAGVYIAKLDLGQGNIQSLRFIKSH